MRNAFLAFLLMASVLGLAQKPPAKFGDIPMEDMRMTIYPLDSSASAVVLFDYGITYYGVPNFIFERHTRIKILKKEGFHEADISIPLLKLGGIRNSDEVLNLRASTFNLENNKKIETKLSKEGEFGDNLNKYINFHKFTFPNVKEGSIIEYSYKIESGVFTTGWQFQQSIPVRWSEYWAMIPDAFQFQKYVQGYVPLTKFSTEKKTYYSAPVEAYHYVAQDVPAFKSEPYMTSESDFISRINFSLSQVNQRGGHNTRDVMSSWSRLNRMLLSSDNFGKAIEKSEFLREDVDRIISGITDTLSRIEALSNYVKQNFEWDGYKNLTGGDLKKVFEEKKGSSGDLNILLASMLNKAGIQVEMVLLSTRDHGFIRKESPMQRQFNYAVCKVNFHNKLLLLDATEKYLPFDVLPSHCLNDQGLIISKLSHGWLDIVAKAKEKTNCTAELSLNQDGILKGTITYTYDGYDALKIRKAFFAKGEEEYTRESQSKKPWVMENIQYKDMSDVTKPVKITHDLQIDEHATKSGDVIFINPFIENRIENPFKSEKREYPVNYGNKLESNYMCKITIPEGFEIDELPQSKVFILPENGAKYTYSLTQMGNTIYIISAFLVNKIVFNQLEYPLLREFYDQVVAKQAEQIVLKKK